MKHCINCGTQLPKVAKFCFNCGVPQPTAAAKKVLYTIDPQQSVEEQIVDQFFHALKYRIEEQHKPNQYKDYLELVYQSRFMETVHLRAAQLATEIAQKQLNYFQISRFLEERYEALLDYFVIHHGKNLNQVHLPEAILKYEGLTLSQINLVQLIFDYLDFGSEEETYYTDFFYMPVKKIRNASQSFLFTAKEEKIFFISDQSILGSCREGFAMTEMALYWKFQFHPSSRVYYDKLDTIEREKTWININSMFFHVNTSIDLKMLKLLKKLKWLHQQ